ncbi:MAG: hypothetical protein HY598_03670 [Candidatus Omnitrophica bacterium]|nr:hypothetical protein [Candidatus Omnitrophota bacterium]
MALLCFCGVVIGRPPGAEALSAQISQPIVDETITRGSVKNGSIEISNQEDQPVSLQVYLEDWEYLEGGTGDKDFLIPGTSPFSAAAWISFYPQKLQLPAHGQGVVEYTIRVPEDAPAGGRYAVMFFETVLKTAAPNEEGVSVQYSGRIGSLFEVSVGGTVRRTGELTDVTVGQYAADRPLSIGMTFKNTGNVAIRPKSFFNIIDASGRYFGRGELPTLYTFPGRSGRAQTEWTGTLPKGSYTMILTSDLGAGQAVVTERQLTVP